MEQMDYNLLFRWFVGLTADAMIAPWVISGAMDGSAFAAYVEKVLIPELEPGTIVILDNLATHKNAVAVRAMRKTSLPGRCLL